MLSKGIEVHSQWAWIGGHRFESYFGGKGNGMSGPIYIYRKGEERVKVNSGFQGWMSRHIKGGNSWGALHTAQRCVPDDQVDLSSPKTVIIEGLHLSWVVSTDSGSAYWPLLFMASHGYWQLKHCGNQGKLIIKRKYGRAYCTARKSSVMRIIIS